MSVFMSDGARVNLSGRVVAARDTGLAIRTRPAQDIDLVVFGFIVIELDKVRFTLMPTPSDRSSDKN